MDITATPFEASQVDALREAMVGGLRAEGWVRSDRVAEAFRAVPRHLFAPGTELETAYADDSVVTKRDEQGNATSAVSAPYIQAMMLEQAGVGAGMRVLEIGSSGCNAALIAELVGVHGVVTTVDIDPGVVESTRQCLAAAGYPDVNVVLADAEGGVPEHAPYDRVIVTAGAWDIPPAWVEQLAVGGWLVVPLRMQGLTRSVVFEQWGERLRSRDVRLCGFVPMQGAGEYRERVVALDGDEVRLRVDGRQEVDADRLQGAVWAPRVERWSGVEIGPFEPMNDLDLWLSTMLPNFCLLTATSSAIDAGIAPRGARIGVSTAVVGGSYAHRVTRPISAERDRFEFGVYAHGADADNLADQYVDLIRMWDREHRSGAGPHIEVHPVDTPDTALPNGLVLDKTHTRVAISWLPTTS